MNYASFRPVAICLFLAVAGVASLSADVCTTAGSRCTDGIFFDSGSGSGGQNHTASLRSCSGSLRLRTLLY